MSAAPDAEVSLPLAGRRVAFVGKLGGMTRREAQQLVRQQGGVPVDSQVGGQGGGHGGVDLIVVGADELPLGEQDELLDEPARQAAAEGRLEIISETQLWQRLGLVESEQHVRRLYTPAMLAELLGVPLATIRRWHRRGLIVPSREVHRLPYFDFNEVATARRLAQLVAAGASPAAIERKLAELARFVPDVERPLAQLSIIVDGQQFLLREEEGLLEPGGQRRIDFETIEERHREQHAPPDAPPPRATVSLEAALGAPLDLATPQELYDLALAAEEEGRIEMAAELLRAVMAAGGPRAEVCFQLAELLYRLGDAGAARERYYMAIELDEDFVEARNNLGCVLAEEGQLELAAAALQGAIVCHPDYPDAHYHLARTLDELGRESEAEHHWQRFLKLAPDSPWADEARDRLGE
jgi:tetratricopeptide (TPR) repeat protein